MEALASLFRGLHNLGRAFVSHILDTAAHGKVVYLLQSWSVTLLMAEATGFCLFFFFFEGVENVKLNLAYLSFAVVYPVVFFVKETWQRRETALKCLAQIKGLSLAIYLCHRDWMKPEAMAPEHVPRAKKYICLLLETLRDALLMPRLTTRDMFFDVLREHRYRAFWRRRAKYRHLIHQYTAVISRLCANMRDFGLTGPERIRLMSFQRQVTLNIEKLFMIKDYRTPQGLRSMARIDSLLMFAVIGVYFAWVGSETGSVLFGALLAAGGGQALGTVINIAAQLEDPFNTGTIRDQVHVSRDLQEVVDTIRHDGEADGESSINKEEVEAMAEEIVQREESLAAADGVELIPFNLPSIAGMSHRALAPASLASASVPLL